MWPTGSTVFVVDRCVLCGWSSIMLPTIPLSPPHTAEMDSDSHIPMAMPVPTSLHMPQPSPPRHMKTSTSTRHHHHGTFPDIMSHFGVTSPSHGQRGPLDSVL